ncbi:Pseudouridine synthase, RsuA/RluB/C/D/E/F [Ostreococcus tauri]|uniref:Pseudouridine synthase, RsuA/RluB/C/D/E/F n=1 Tax=Ostreococcus tauri TaxID=70448 RepID=A0A090MAD4_OSTTA|nr:Pseudouridine synthase, RsuA/RluB/C/D/E/F [Ostreococcus tauri]CEF99064.1 Pseudouridine synthase, RsuA/RluB/C/D/E/F [Ostreococcus tauri]|eukprot:XP_022839624.1 Pseudouridine synthase, RsuA/RluB/C/D/E/F [Ostreococcus tauri]
MDAAIADLRERFKLPSDTSSAALERALRELAVRRGSPTSEARIDDFHSRFDRDDVRADDARARRAGASDVGDVTPGVVGAKTSRGETASEAVKMKNHAARGTAARGLDARVDRAKELESLASLEVRAREGKIKMLEEERDAWRARARAATHERVAATIRATTTTREGERDQVGKIPKDSSAALAKCWGTLSERAGNGSSSADVLLLMREYKRARRERTRAFERIAELEGELARAREDVLVMEKRERKTLRTRATAEAIMDEEADEKLTLRSKLKETLEERAALVVTVETQRDEIDELKKAERRTREEVVRLEKELVRGRSNRDKLRSSLRDLERIERESAERGARLAHVEAECDFLAQMVREMRRASGSSGPEFMRAAERALLVGSSASPARSPPPEPRATSSASEEDDDRDGYGTPNEASTVDIDDGRLTDDDFPSPPISNITRRFASTPDSAASASSVAFAFGDTPRRA